MNMEDKEFMKKYILNNPFEFKQGIISHCREMDKIDVYNWVAEDELKIDKLQQENKQLKEELEYTIRIVEHNRIINEKNKEIHQLKDNWNKLKEFVLKKQAVLFNTEYTCYSNILDKMQELEQGSGSNVKD